MTRATKVVIGTAVAGVVAVGAWLALSRERLHQCGHPITAGDYLGQFAGYRSISRHCCGSLTVIGALRSIEGMMESYRLEYGSNAISLAQLEEYCDVSILSGRRSQIQLQFFSEGQLWWVAVPQQGTWAGNYLLTSEGRIHFNKTGPATTNDVDLCDRNSR